jgi:hypothetical protein
MIVCNVKLERNSKNIYTQKNAEHENEFCRWCTSSLKVTYGDTWKSVSIVNLLKPTVGPVGQDYSFEVILQNIGIVCERGPEWSERLCGTCIKIKCALTWDSSITKATKRLRKWQLEYFKASTEHLSRTFSVDPNIKWNFPNFISYMFGSSPTAQTELIPRSLASSIWSSIILIRGQMNKWWWP